MTIPGRNALGTLVAAATLLSGAAAGAVERKLSADEIEALLSDNTALGEHRGTPTRQYFDARGSTDYLAKGGMIDRGKWKVDRDKNQYCSWWQRGGWSCYDVLREGATYYWSQDGLLPGSGYRSPFSMTSGYKMTF